MYSSSKIYQGDCIYQDDYIGDIGETERNVTIALIVFWFVIIANALSNKKQTKTWKQYMLL